MNMGNFLPLVAMLLVPLACDPLGPAGTSCFLEHYCN